MTPRQVNSKRIRPHSEVSLKNLPDVSCSYASAVEAVWRAIDQLDVMLAAKGAYPNRQALPILRRDLPYVVHETALEGKQILLNRQYKPLGCNLADSGKWVSYEAYPQLHVHLTEDEIGEIACPPYPNALFGDGCPPWGSKQQAMEYRTRLQRLYRFITRTEKAET